MKVKVKPKTKESEVNYQLTPKGCALMAMLKSGLIDDMDDVRVEEFWKIFEILINRLIEES